MTAYDGIPWASGDVHAGTHVMWSCDALAGIPPLGRALQSSWSLDKATGHTASETWNKLEESLPYLDLILPPYPP